MTYRQQAFTSPGTWVCPPTTTQVNVFLVGGGGGGLLDVNPVIPSGRGAGGGGGIREAIVPVSGPVPVTVGAGGTGVGGNPIPAPLVATASAGGDSAFGPLAPPIPASTIKVGGGGVGGGNAPPDGGGGGGSSLGRGTPGTYGSPIYNTYAYENAANGGINGIPSRGPQANSPSPFMPVWQYHGQSSQYVIYGHGGSNLDAGNTPLSLVRFVGQAVTNYPTPAPTFQATAATLPNTGHGGSIYYDGVLAQGFPGTAGVVIVRWFE